ncbi:MAG TPA: hypothetical protein VL625_10340, partial [Patescibacteria group bacterium]|nr:hypothetical protein [Patescibacteria group bacterium]
SLLKALSYPFLMAALFYTGFHFPRELTLLTGFLLMYHVYAGEVKFIKRPFNLPYLVLITALGAVTTSWLYARLWDAQLNLPLLWIPVLITAAVAVGLFIYDRGKLEIEMYFWSLLFMLLVLLGLEVTGHRPVPVQILGFVVLAHYMTFYVHVVRRFWKQESKKKLKIFLAEGIASNAAFVGIFIVVMYVLNGHSIAYPYLFTPIAFYVWSLFHFITTFRPEDYKDALKIRMPAPLTEAYA